MAEEDEDQKTEYPTGKRLGEARDKGQLPISRETTNWVKFLSILIVVAWLAPAMSSQLVTTLRVFLESPDAIRLDDRSLQTVILNSVLQTALATGLIFALLAFACIIGVMAQTGLYASLTLIKPDIGRLNPAGGFKRLFSIGAAVELGKSFGKLVVLGTATYYTLLPLVNDLPAMIGHPLFDGLAYLHHQALHLIIVLLLIFTFIAMADYFYQNYSYIKKLRMTRAEVKDEYRQMEGDPIIKSRLRQIRVERARKRMMAQVPKADVVITNPTHYAVAMQYDNKRMTAPVVLAKGIDRIAERIRELAEENKIPLISNPPLARALYDTVEVDQEIPTQHYRAVAEIISYVYKLKKRKL